MHLKDTPVENQRPLKVAVIGAGYSGIYCGIRIPERLRNVELTIFDKNAGLGGTWWENRYPGCACDIPSHSYQYSFSPNPSWSCMYAPAAEIQAYLQSVAEKYSVPRLVKLRHAVKESRWNEDEGHWQLKVVDLNTGTTMEHVAHVLINARGALNDIAWPMIDGLDSFRGKIVHSAAWDEQFDFSDKRIGVIGGGSSAIQIVPSLQKLPGTHLSCFARSRTWISRTFADATMQKLGMESEYYSVKQRDKFREDPNEYRKFRKVIESDGNAIHDLTLRGSQISEGARKQMAEHMQQRLSKKPEVAEFMIPSFAPGCRRLTPGPGYLEALAEDNVDFITTKIKKIHPDGVELENGTFTKLDVLVCATGFQAFAPARFPIIGQGGKTIKEHFTPIPESYLSLATDGFPNFFMMLGPNSAIGSGSLTIMIESVGDYITKCIRKIQKEDIKSMTIKKERVQDFQNYKNEYFKRTVFLDECRSWYRSEGGDGNVIVGLWPGSNLHAVETMSSPRWEDYQYTYRHDTESEGNALRFLGNGWSQIQLEKGDLAWYLEPEYMDVPATPFPEETPYYKVRPYVY